MKYLKTFESSDKYWLILTKSPDFKISLEKIGMSEDLIEEWSLLFENDKQHKEIYMKKTYYSDGTISWSWSESHMDHTYDKYMGTIKITPEDIKIYNIKNDSKKYNL